MTKPAGKIVALTELRFRPANSNDAARAVVAHHFADVPHCAFAGDDGISSYLGSETGMGSFPTAPDFAEPEDSDIPAIDSETPVAKPDLRCKLMRGGFGLSIFLHALLAAAIGLAAHTIPDDAALEQGMMSVTIVTQGTSEVDARLAGGEEEVEAPFEKPADIVPKEMTKPVEAVETPAVEEKPIKVEVKPTEKPPEIKTEQLPKMPLPVPGADLPEILTSQASKTETEAVVQPLPTEKKVELVEKQITPAAAEKAVELKPVERPVEQKPIEKQPEEKPKDVGKKIEEKKERHRKEEQQENKLQKKRRQNQGNQGNATINGTKGEVNTKDEGRASTSSRGASNSRETGNAARTNYKGLVNRKLSRAKGRISAPAKGEVWVGFTILSDGSISGLSVTRSSGKAALDAIALKVVRNALPFPSIPAEAGRKSWKMSVPMTFKGG